MNNLRTILLTSALAVITLTSAFAKDKPAANKGNDKKADTYPLTTCVVSDEKLGEMGEPYVYKHEGREIRFCCKPCSKDFKKNPAKYLKKLDDAEKKAKKS